MIKITYENEKTVDVDNEDLTILEISTINGIPHVCACGGNAKCSTCRVIILNNHENVLPPNYLETELGRKKGFESNIRLACQTKVRGPVKLRRLVLDESDVRLTAADKNTTGRVQKIAIMFTDIRNFTGFSENNLCYDIVHILNRYFFVMGRVINDYDGYIDKYMGDGIMAMFGLECDSPETACESAVRAGLEMFKALDELNKYLGNYFDTNFKIGVGIHFGEVIVGELGHPSKMQFSAIGDNVNITSRVETATKLLNAPLLVTEAVYDRIDSELFESGRVFRDTELKGKNDKHTLYEIINIY